MQALGLGLVCESIPFLAYREAIGLGLPVLTGCTGISDACATGEEIEVDFLHGRFINHTRGTAIEVPAVPEGLREVVAMGGTTNWLKRWWQERSGNATPA
jgi:3-isopropylmalate/(R)-2-methylmalate dehydratase small subunit